MPYAVPTDLEQWAIDMETVGGLPSSDTPALIAWGAAEGGSFHNTAYGNVLNTTKTLPGVPSINTGTQGDIQSFAIPGQTQAEDWQEGIEADLSTINQSNMVDIRSALEGGNPSALPSALEKDPWGTNSASVAAILGENPDTIDALGGATTTSSGGNGVVLTSSNPDDAQTTGLVSSTLGTAASFFGIRSGSHILVRGAFALFGLILLIIAFKEMFSSHDAVQTVTNVPASGYRTVKSGVKKVGTAVAVT